jgi:N-acetylneuraminate synthase
MPQFRIGQRWVGDGHPAYFVADVAANHDGELERARLLIHLAKEAGADAAKFQNFRAPKIVSRYGFESMGAKRSHQAAWTKSVYEVYEEAALPWEWTKKLKKECDAAGIDYFSAPYDLEAVDMLDPFVEVFKIGSGDITWPEMLSEIAGRGKPIILSTGASSMGDVQRAVHIIRQANPALALLQCNTNYTGSRENFRHIHLAVLRTYRTLFPDVVLGLSDHTPGHATVLGAVALGARVIEKHFTDDRARPGPDHPFSMDPAAWREMVDRTRELELALGSPDKRVADNERETVIVQRRCLRAARDLESGTVLTREMIEALRPAPVEAIPAFELARVVGRRLRRRARAGEHFSWEMLE